MDLLDKLSGKISKLEFRAFLDEKFLKKVGEPFTVQYNPKSLGISYANLYVISDDKSVPSKFVKATNPDLSVEFILDGTGIDSSVFNGFQRVDVQDQIIKFLAICKDIQPDKHEPHYVQICYGTLVYQTRFKSCDVTYTLFKPDGSPLRATVKAAFLSIKDSVSDNVIKSLSSPDVTHRRLISSNQSIPEIANDIYERNDLYLKVARANNLDTFRKVSPEMNIYFPPLNI